MKRAAFANIPDLHNYDLESSQIWILCQFFEDAQLDTTWLTSYLQTGKEAYYNSVGLNKDTWKNCFISLIFGSAPPETLKLNGLNKQVQNSAIAKYILEYFNNEYDLAKPCVEAFYSLTKPLHINLRLWHLWLYNVHIKRPGISTIAKGKHYVRNSTELTLCISDYLDKKGNPTNELYRKLAAFYLQGSESLFIHYLTFLQGNYNYKVLSNQHDGLVTEGVIPQDAITRAQQLSGLKYAILKEKPFT